MVNNSLAFCCSCVHGASSECCKKMPSCVGPKWLWPFKLWQTMFSVLQWKWSLRSQWFWVIQVLLLLQLWLIHWHVPCNKHEGMYPKTYINKTVMVWFYCELWYIPFHFLSLFVTYLSLSLSLIIKRVMMYLSSSFTIFINLYIYRPQIKLVL